MAASPGEEAAQRAAELLRRGAELAARKAVTEEDVQRAAEHAARRDLQAAQEGGEQDP
jgi:hypothetical protein